MQNTIRKISLFVLMLFITSNAGAEKIISGELESHDGKFKHNFKASGDYWGQVKSKDFDPSSVSGVFEQGNGICWNSLANGSKGASGNVLIYVEEVQCCLEFREISNKFAVSKVWVKGTGTGYALCNNQVLTKKKK